MKDANERIKKLYETLITFEENDYSEVDIANHLKKMYELSKENKIPAREYMETARIYYVLREKKKYVEVIKFHNAETNKDETYMQITELGWDFINNYQSNERDMETKLRDSERIKLLEKSHLENESRIANLTKWLVIATFFLGLGAIVEVLKYFHIHICQ